MNTRHESFPSRYGSPREDKFTCFGWNRLNSIISVQSSSNVCDTKHRSTKFQIWRRSKRNSKLKFHTLTEKIITGVKFTLSSHVAQAGTRAITLPKPCCKPTNIREGFTNDPTTHHYRVLHDPATHHTSEGLSYMTRTTEPQKNSQPKVSLKHYVGHPTQPSYG